MSKKIWVAITAHKPLERIDCLVNLLRGYMEFPFTFETNIYIDYDSQDDVEILETLLSEFSKLNLQIKVASPGISNPTASPIKLFPSFLLTIN